MFKKYHGNIYRKTSISESFFNNVAGLLKRNSNTGVFLWILHEILKSTYFEEHLCWRCLKFEIGLLWEAAFKTTLKLFFKKSKLTKLCRISDNYYKSFNFAEFCG